MVTQLARLKSFERSPKVFHAKKEMFVEAGFYYTGHSDHVRCFYCNGALKNWIPKDDPWLEHAKFFPFCTHMILTKGDAFIRNAATTASNGCLTVESEVAASGTVLFSRIILFSHPLIMLQ